MKCFLVFFFLSFFLLHMGSGDSILLSGLGRRDTHQICLPREKIFGGCRSGNVRSKCFLQLFFVLFCFFHRKDVLQGFPSRQYTPMLQIINSFITKALGQTKKSAIDPRKWRKPPSVLQTVVSSFAMQLLKEPNKAKQIQSPMAQNSPCLETNVEKKDVIHKERCTGLILFCTLSGILIWERERFHSNVGIASKLAFMEYTKPCQVFVKKMLSHSQH